MEKTRVQKYTVLILAFALIVTTLTAFDANANPLDITVQLDSEPIVDVVLTVGNTNHNLTNFERDLKNSLEAKGVSTKNLAIQAIETSTVEANASNAQEVLSEWDGMKVPGGASSGSNDFEIRGNKIVRTTAGSTRPASAFIDNAAESKNIEDAVYKFRWGIDSRNYGSFVHGEAGFLFRVQDSNNFYAYLNDNHSACGNIRIDGGEAIVRVVNGSFQILAQSSFPRYTPGQIEDMEIHLKGSNIKVYRNGKKVLEANDSRYKKGTHGFYVWDQYGAYFSNISYETEVIRDFSEVIRQPSWRAGSQRYLVNFENSVINDFNSPSASGEILTRLINEEIHYLGAGSSTNRAQSQNLIARNNNNGEFYQNASYSTIINNTAQYIKDNLPKATEVTEEKYVLMGEPFKLSVYPSNLLKNTATTEFPNGRWRIDHEYDYFDNDTGQTSWTDRWQKDLYLPLDKPGKYEIRFGDKHPIPRYIYVHRRPVADFSMVVSKSGSNYNVSVNDTSYDPDYEYSDPNKGIVSSEWKWRTTTSTTWNNGKIPSNLPSGNDYIVQLRVKDKQGVWSVPEAKYITTDSVRVPPVATFNFSPNPVSKYETLNVNDNSYDPAGKTITSRQWKVYRGGSEIYSGSTPLTNFRNRTEGDYVVSLRVRNSSGDWSETYSRGLTVTGDNVAPSAIIDPTSSDATNENVRVNVKYSDAGGSGFKHQRYAVTSSPNPPNSGWSSWSNSENINVTISQEGRMYLHLEAYDNANNKFTRTAGEYLIDKTPPVLNIKEESTEISHEDTTILVNATDELSGVRFIRYLDVDGNSGIVINNELKVRKNGIYTFFAEDMAGNISEKTYEVNSLDKTLSFTSPNISNFASIEIPEVITKVNTNVGKMVIKDWRDGDNSWRMQVSATPLEGDRNTLTPGVLALNIDSIVKTEGEGQLPTNNMSRKTPIDNDTVNILTANDSRGAYEVNFGNLELTVDNSEIMIGKYSTTITWEIIQGP